MSTLREALKDALHALEGKDIAGARLALRAALAVVPSESERPFVVRQFEGTPWVPLHEAARLHDAVQEAGLTIAALRNSLAAVPSESDAGLDAPKWGPLNDQWLMTAIVRIPRDLWPTGLRLGDTVEAVAREYEAIRLSGGTPASPAAIEARP